MAELKQLLGPVLVALVILASLVSMGIIRVTHPLLHCKPLVTLDSNLIIIRDVVTKRG